MWGRWPEEGWRGEADPEEEERGEMRAWRRGIRAGEGEEEGPRKGGGGWAEGSQANRERGGLGRGEQRGHGFPGKQEAWSFLLLFITGEKIRTWGRCEGSGAQVGSGSTGARPKHRGASVTRLLLPPKPHPPQRKTIGSRGLEGGEGPPQHPATEEGCR